MAKYIELRIKLTPDGEQELENDLGEAIKDLIMTNDDGFDFISDVTYEVKEK